jgi:hypothetical protein
MGRSIGEERVSEPVKHLFLDIDGVLNHYDFVTSSKTEAAQAEQIRLWDGKRTWRWWNEMIEPEPMARLQRVVTETDTRIILSSAWRQLLNHDTIATLFRFHKLHIAGMTPTLESEIRGDEIAKWLRGWGDLSRQTYAIVDDNSDAGIGHAPERFVHVTGRKGMTDADAERLIGILGRIR